MKNFHHISSLAALSSALVVLVACNAADDTAVLAGEHATAQAARNEMVGLSEAQLRMCAGFPDASSDHGEDGKIWTYRRSTNRNNMNLVVPASGFGIIPAVGGSVSLSGGGYCHTQVRLADGRVAEVEFAGDSNRARSRNALCVTMVDSCVNYARRNR